MRFRLDRSFQRFGDVVVAGSPLRLFRLGTKGVTVVECLERGDAVEPSMLTDRLVDAGAVHPLPGRGRYTVADVTVVRPVYTRSGIDASTLHAADAARTIVVDDASPVTVAGATIRLDTNQGPAAARNAGLALVGTPLVAFVDADVVLHPGWLSGLVDHFAHDRVAVVAPRIRSVGGHHGVLSAYERQRSPLDLGGEPARIRAGTRVSYVPAAAIVCLTEAVRSMDGFDTSLRFGEDVDLVWRLDTAGYQCRYEPAVSVGHAPRASWSAWLTQRIGYGSSAAPLARRHPKALAPARLNGWSAAAWLLAVTGRPAAGVVLTLASAGALVVKLRAVPPQVSVRLAALGTFRAGRSLADATRRVWWPIVAVAALRSRLARRVGVAALLAAGHPVRALDDLAYGVGVWRGIWRERTVAPLVPELSSWPTRRRGDR